MQLQKAWKINTYLLLLAEILETMANLQCALWDTKAYKKCAVWDTKANLQCALWDTKANIQFVLFQQISDYKNKAIQRRGVEANGAMALQPVETPAKSMKEKHFCNESSRCCLRACLKPFSTPIAQIQRGKPFHEEAHW